MARLAVTMVIATMLNTATDNAAAGAATTARTATAARAPVAATPVMAEQQHNHHHHHNPLNACVIAAAIALTALSLSVTGWAQAYLPIKFIPSPARAHSAALPTPCGLRSSGEGMMIEKAGQPEPEGQPAAPLAAWSTGSRAARPLG